MVERAGVPLCVVLTGANRHASMALTDVVDAVHPVRNRGIIPRIARRGVETSHKPGKHRLCINLWMLPVDM